MSQSTEITLNSLFDEAYKLFESFDKRDDPSNSSEFQQSVKKCIKMFEDSTRLVSECGMFSKNETYEEISTNDLKFLLLPYFLAQTTLKLCVQDRKNIVDVAKIYYEDFLKRCEEYGLCERSSTAVSKATDIVVRDEMARLTQMAQQRNQKLQKYQQKKELNDQIKQLKIAMEHDFSDDEIKRNFYLKLIKLCVWESQDELSTLDQEFEILKHIEGLRKHDPDFEKSSGNTAKHPHTQTPLKPIIITKDVIQKAVYGLGYPSLPTYTVKEFYDQRVAEGIFPSEEQLKAKSLQGRVEIDQEAEQAREEEEKELKIDNDDPEYLQRTRNMDEYKDDHRRGYGNRYNRS
ncbi:CLUMA_CG014059, isoform A [Clunio marinus]|uniref:CLUMA_CG014059, isoform A n=1 Tax=Clunio marinus TaxID=568069 RepID=A0A1J1IKP4_9DIPT|nr:CLUMA_CG014059, isoform A [Clunio marinus]